MLFSCTQCVVGGAALTSERLLPLAHNIFEDGVVAGIMEGGSGVGVGVGVGDVYEPSFSFLIIYIFHTKFMCRTGNYTNYSKLPLATFFMGCFARLNLQSNLDRFYLQAIFGILP